MLVREGVDIPRFMLIELVVAGVLVALVAAFFRRQPPSPPSFSAAVTTAAALSPDRSAFAGATATAAVFAATASAGAIAEGTGDAGAGNEETQRLLARTGRRWQWRGWTRALSSLPWRPKMTAGLACCARDCGAIFRRGRFVALVAAGGALMGSSWALNTVLARTLEPLGVGGEASGWIGRKWREGMRVSGNQSRICLA